METRNALSKEEYKSKHKFFKKWATDLFLQIFYSYIDNTKNKGFFTCLKEKHEKERYLGLGNMEIRNALSKLRMFSFKLANVTENGSKQKWRTNMQILWLMWSWRWDSFLSLMPTL